MGQFFQPGSELTTESSHSNYQSLSSLWHQLRISPKSKLDMVPIFDLVSLLVKQNWEKRRNRHVRNSFSDKLDDELGIESFVKQRHALEKCVLVTREVSNRLILNINRLIRTWSREGFRNRVLLYPCFLRVCSLSVTESFVEASYLCARLSGSVSKQALWLVKVYDVYVKRRTCEDSDSEDTRGGCYRTACFDASLHRVADGIGSVNDRSTKRSASFAG